MQEVKQPTDASAKPPRKPGSGGGGRGAGRTPALTWAERAEQHPDRSSTTQVTLPHDLGAWLEEAAAIESDATGEKITVQQMLVLLARRAQIQTQIL